MSSRKAKKGHNKLVLRPRESKHGSKRVSTFNHNKRRLIHAAWGPRLLFAGRSKRSAQKEEDEADPNGGQEEDANSDGSQEEALADHD